MTAPTSDPTDDGAPGSRLRYPRGTEEFGRFLSFTDGVVAIALTLLILGIDVPVPTAGTPDPAILTMLGDLWPQIFAYLLSFAIIAVYWLQHHRFIAALVAIDTPIMVWNFAFLLLIGFMPLIADVMGFYGDDEGAVVLYALWFVCFGIVDIAGYLVAWRRRLIEHEPSGAMVSYMIRVRLGAPLVFLSSIPVAYFVSVQVATWSWLLIWPVSALLTRNRPER